MPPLACRVSVKALYDDIIKEKEAEAEQMEEMKGMGNFVLIKLEEYKYLEVIEEGGEKKYSTLTVNRASGNGAGNQQKNKDVDTVLHLNGLICIDEESNQEVTLINDD
eukprot:11768726-Ditylum_brightwellii.AAC.1